MSISPVHSSVASPVKPASTKPPVRSTDADGDHDGTTKAQAAAEKRGGVDVKG